MDDLLLGGRTFIFSVALQNWGQVGRSVATRCVALPDEPLVRR